jgi:hypothetical protein
MCGLQPPPPNFERSHARASTTSFFDRHFTSWRTPSFGAKVVTHARYVGFQLTEIAVPRQLFAQILERIARLCPACASG